MAAKTEPLPGTSDIFPEESGAWRLLEDAAHRVFPRYGYGEIRTPVFERTDVFQRGIGAETDVVQKEMYTFADRGGRSLTLRPEGTAGVIRALANMGIPQGDERRVYYHGAMFRGERPAAGRKRQFHQVGTECVGKEAPAIDAEAIEMMMVYLEAVDIRATRLLLNTRGIPAERPHVAKVLHDFFAPHREALCEDCRRRLETNVWRVLDCKVESCRELVEQAPLMMDLFSEETRAYFQQVCHCLDVLGIAYELDPRLVRGLDYYCHTVFEVVYEGIGAQNSIAGGGRYRIDLAGVKQPVEGVGFAAGMERLLLARESLGVAAEAAGVVDVYAVSMGAEAMDRNLQLVRDLRRRGLRAMMDLEGRGMKAQMRSANKSGAPWTIILGGDELARGVAVCKHMVSGEQVDLPLAELPDYLAARLRTED